MYSRHSLETDRSTCFKRKITLTIGTFINERATLLPLLQGSNRPIFRSLWILNTSTAMNGSQYWSYLLCTVPLSSRFVLTCRQQCTRFQQNPRSDTSPAGYLSQPFPHLKTHTNKMQHPLLSNNPHSTLQFSPPNRLYILTFPNATLQLHANLSSATRRLAARPGLAPTAWLQWVVLRWGIRRVRMGLVRFLPTPFWRTEWAERLGSRLQ